MKKDSWLYSDSFLKRAFAIWGYNFVANLILLIPVYIVIFAVAIGATFFMKTMEKSNSEKPPFMDSNIEFEELDLPDFQLELEDELSAF